MTFSLEAVKSNWNEVVAKYQKPDLKKSIWQLLNTTVPFFVVWYLMYLSLDFSYWLTLALSPIAAGLLIRIFIFQHDCGHGAFFKSQKANNVVGFLCGVLTMVPYQYWRKSHAMHHAGASNLDRRGFGDVTTLTVREYLKLSKWGRLKYRLYRNPLILFVVGPTFYFLVLNRFPSAASKQWIRERRSVYWTNLALLALVLLLGFTIGFRELVMIHLPIEVFAATAGTWLFYIQHQFEDTYWEHNDEWEYVMAALQGSSFYRLPKVLQWFTGNIGYHHIHHLSSRIPNYNLQKCYEENPVFHQSETLTFWQSLKCIPLKLWDEEQRKLVGYRHLKTLRQPVARRLNA
ncbi:fatty acid desaturase [candidate division KSB1 bacterium]|nr:fatty acid desaturase [bacterium]NUM66738.1 fatty acid desaturase [candidate division KSB1 bacterium]